MSHPSRLSFGAAATAVSLAAALVVLPAGGAAAHDTLSDSTPTDQQRLESAPSEIVLEFDAEPMDIGTAVIVVDSGGEDLTAGPARIEGNTVVADLNPDELGEDGYEVRWRVVSSDGHPISGVVGFTVGDAEPFQMPAGDRTDEPVDPADTADPADTEGPAVGDPADGTPPSPGYSPVRLILIGVIGAVLATGAFLLFTRLRNPPSVSSTDSADPDRD